MNKISLSFFILFFIFPPNMSQAMEFFSKKDVRIFEQYELYQMLENQNTYVQYQHLHQELQILTSASHPITREAYLNYAQKKEALDDQYQRMCTIPPNEYLLVQEARKSLIKNVKKIKKMVEKLERKLVIPPLPLFSVPIEEDNDYEEIEMQPLASIGIQIQVAEV